MKELSIEEKAQRYDNAIEIAKSLYDYNQPISASNVIINNIFPQFKESEDEKIRKDIIKAFKVFEEKQSWVGHCLDDIDWDACYAYLEKQSEQKPVEWSEEDEAMLENIKEILTKQGFHQIQANWLKSLKDRVQPQQDWSKDDKIRINEIIETLNIVQENRKHTVRVHYSKSVIDKNIAWLKSLKDRCQPRYWKPSEEQMKALDTAVTTGNLSFKDMDILSTLRRDLKAL